MGSFLHNYKNYEKLRLTINSFGCFVSLFASHTGTPAFVFQRPVQAARSFATVTCASTLLWCATAYRTVSFPGMKATAKVLQLCQSTLQFFL